MDDLEISEAEHAELKVAPISDELAAALAAAEETGGHVLFDLVDGTLVVNHDSEAA